MHGAHVSTGSSVQTEDVLIVTSDQDGPAFLGIGAQKAGTTWLYRNLLRHPDVWLPPVKELHYFDLFPQVQDLGHVAYLRRMVSGNTGFDERWRRFVRAAVERNRSARSLRMLRWDLRHLFGKPTDRWYRRLFHLASEGQVAGEITPGYSALSDDAVARAREVIGDARLLLFLRNPIERAWSHAVMDLRRKDRDPAGATDHEFERHFDGRPSRQRTSYADILERWESAFGTELLFVGFLEDIALHPAATLGRVYEFLGLPPEVPHPVIDDAVFSGSVGAIPRPHAVRLARMYLPDLERLEPRFGGYVTRWREVAELLAADRSLPDEISYPLWRPEPNQSGPLSAPLRSTTAARPVDPVPTLSSSAPRER